MVMMVVIELLFSVFYLSGGAVPNKDESKRFFSRNTMRKPDIRPGILEMNSFGTRNELMRLRAPRKQGDFHLTPVPPSCPEPDMDFFQDAAPDVREAYMMKNRDMQRRRRRSEQFLIWSPNLAFAQ